MINQDFTLSRKIMKIQMHELLKCKNTGLIKSKEQWLSFYKKSIKNKLAYDLLDVHIKYGELFLIKNNE